LATKVYFFRDAGYVRYGAGTIVALPPI